MFRGITSINLDPKGRVAIPARYRDALQGKGPELILTIDTHSPCLLLYPTHEWELIEAKLQQLSSFNPATRRIQRLLMGHATELELDGAGRILIPQLLRDYAELNKESILVGQGRKFELWDKNKWYAGRQQWLDEESRLTQEHIPEELLNISL